MKKLKATIITNKLIMHLKKLLTKMLLVAAALGVGQRAWAVDVANYNFDSQTTPFTIFDTNRIGVTYAEHVENDGDYYAKYTCTNMNKVAFAYYDFKSLTNDAATVTISFDFNIGQDPGHALISLADADVHTGTKGGFTAQSNTGYGSNGTIFNLGCYRADNANNFAINSSKRTDLTTSCLNNWCHATITVDNIEKKVSYSITNLSGATEYASASNLSFLSTNAERCSQIDIYLGAWNKDYNNNASIDNLVITKTVSEVNHNFTINAVAGGNTIKELSSGSASEGAQYGCYIPLVVVSNDGKFYVKDDTNVSNYYISAFMGSADQVITVNYSLDESIVAFLESGTNVRQDGSNIPSYSSGNYACVESNKQSSLGTLNKGFYTFEAYLHERGDRGLYLRDANNSTITTNTIVAQNINKNSSAGLYKINFSLSAETAINLSGCTDSKNKYNQSSGFDYVLIRKTADATFKITNADMETGGDTTLDYWKQGVAGWSTENTSGNYRQVAVANVNNTSGAFSGTNAYENYCGVAPYLTGKMYQIISDLPNGIYKVNLAAFVNNLNGQLVYGKSNDITYSIPVSVANATRAFSVFATVSGGSLEIGLDMNNAGNSWSAIDNAGLIYYGDTFSEEDIAELIALVPVDNMLATTQSALTNAKTNFESSATATNANALLAAIDAANLSIDAYASLGVKLAEAASVRAAVVANTPSYLSTFDTNIGTITTNYNNGSIAENEISTQVANVETEILSLVKSQTNNGSDMTRAIINADGSANPVSGWQLENALADGELFQYDGHSGTASGMNVPFVEYWHAGNGTNISTNKISQIITGLQNGNYTVTATTFVNNEYRANENDSYTAPSAGSALLFANNETKDITTGGTTTSFNGTTGTFSVDVEVTNGTLELGVKTVSPNYNWIGFKDVKLTYYSGYAVATLGTNGYATFASPYALDLTGVDAYKAAVDGTTVKFTALSQTVPANTGVLLKGTAGAKVDIPVVAEGTTVTDNAFLVNETGETFAGDNDYYYFGMKAGSLTFGLFDPATVAIPANKAYLKVLKSSLENQARLTVVFDDEATGIKAVGNSQLQADGYYNLNGQRIGKPSKGLYIVNGKKVIIK